MHFILDLLQGAGIAAAIGIRPFLPVVLVGVLALANLGVDFEGTDLSFLESWPFLVAVGLVLVATLALVRDGGTNLRGVAGLLLAAAVVLAGLEASGSMLDRGHSAVIGAVVGVAAALLGFFATRSLFARARRRLDAEAAPALPVYGELAAAAAAGLSVLFPPLALVVLVMLGLLMTGGRRREGEKYAGLRILR